MISVLLLTFFSSVLGQESEAWREIQTGGDRRDPSIRDDGLPAHVKWYRSYERAIAAAKQNRKLTLVLFTRTSCQSCIYLKRGLAFPDDLAGLQVAMEFEVTSEKFNMVSLVDIQEVPPRFQESDYVPRVYFMTPDEEEILVGSPNEQYGPYPRFFGKPEWLVDGMKRALGDYATKQEQNTKQDEL